jgi:signal transduction protein with GAF and PtsI domain
LRSPFRRCCGGILPPPPPELQGQALNIVHQHAGAGAARSRYGIVDRLLGTVGSMAQMKPEVLDKIDSDKVVDAYADMLGIDPDLIVGDDQVALIRQDRAKVQQQQAQQAQVAQGAATAKTLSQAKTGNENNALTDAINQFSGYTGQAAG